MHAALARALIQKCPRGVAPSRVITAPEPGMRANLLSETDRLAQFRASELRPRTACGPLPNRPVERDRALVPL